MRGTKTALVTGVTGQDGAILAQLLLSKGYQVHGLRPYSAVPDTGRINDLDDLILHYGDMTDGGNLIRLLEAVKPDEIYNMAALSHVHVSFDVPETTANINALGPLRMLEAMRTLGAQKQMKFYQASSSEMFGRSPAPQNEETIFAPCSPYGTAKLFAYWTVRNYREAYGLYSANGILFNHESALRGEEFVTRKITKAVCEIEAGLRDKIMLGNLDSRRDWGDARDYMEGVWQILQQENPDDYVLATGQSYSVREFVEKAFAVTGQQIIWDGEGLDEVGRDKMTGKILVEIDPSLFRPKEVHVLLGDTAKAKKYLGWRPKISFDQLVEDMMSADRLISKKTKSYAA
ncbi:MAG TPA: GDP-mannose 4,6-dehydratase [Alphaproteobacteria bacterium]|nr:GDP-mannose 4,6-dehydratase [Alphaproteobacteria bacterium]